MHRFEILATNFATPDLVQTSTELASIVNRNATWIDENVGVKQRHISQFGDDPAELAAAAARPIIEAYGAPDLLIYASASSRQCVPDTSVFVAHLLGLSSIPAFSVNATCLSFLVALQNGVGLMALGMHRKILIVSAELPSLSRNFEDAESASLFGDGAAAVLMAATERDSGLEAFRMQLWPEHRELTQVRGGGLKRHPLHGSTGPEDYWFEMKGESLLRVSIVKLRRFVEQFLEDSRMEITDFDLIVPHQASKPGLRILEQLSFPASRTVNILENYGNTVSASIPMALAIANEQKRIQSGSRLFLIGTAAGLSIGAAIIKW